MPIPTSEEAFAALRRGGLVPNDPALVALFDVSKPDFVYRARAAKPYLFDNASCTTSSTARKPAADSGIDKFDARTANPEEVEARLAELTRGTSRPALVRRDGLRSDALTLSNLRKGH